MSLRAKRIMFEAAGILSALLGATILVFGGLLPVLNPGFSRLNGGGEGFDAANGFACVVGAAALAAGVFCSWKAGRLKRDEAPDDTKRPGEN